MSSTRLAALLAAITAASWTTLLRADSKSDGLALARQWAREHLEPAAAVPPFSFRYDGQSSADLLKTWKAQRTSRKLDAHRTQTTIRYTDPRTALEVRCVLVEYDDFPTIEWTIYLENKGAADTPILEDIQSLDIRLERRAKDKAREFLLHHHVGSPAKRNDYCPLETPLPPNSAKTLGAAGGRPTNSDLSYCNLEWDQQGLMLAIGWPGQWRAVFQRDAGRGLRIRSGQELTRLLLRPGEEIRTPLVALQFWKGGDWIDAQNVWRRWMLAYNVPRTKGALPAPMLAGATCYFFNFTKNSEENQRLFIEGCVAKELKLDCWWIDAGWYPCDGSWPETGNWWPDPLRFPSGLKPISELAHRNGIALLTWFEPERVHAGTWLAQNHPEWIHGGRKGGLLDLGNPEARTWLTNHVDQLLTEQGIDIYRQD